MVFAWYWDKVIKDLNPTLVIFDALIRLHNSKENDNSEMSQVMGRIRDLIIKTGVTTLTIHHDRKGQGDRKERARGGGDIVGAIDSQICLEPKDDDTLLLSPGKGRMAPFQAIKLKIEGEGDSLSFTYLGREVGEAGEILAEVVELLGANSMGVEEIDTALKGRGYTIGINRLRGILRQAVGQELESYRGLRGKLSYSVNSSFTASRGIYSPLNCEGSRDDLKLLHKNPLCGKETVKTIEMPFSDEIDLTGVDFEVVE